MNKKIGTFDKKKISKNTVCRVPVRAHYSLGEQGLDTLDIEYSDIPLDRFGRYIAGRLGIDL